MQNDIKDHTQNQWATILPRLGVDSSLLDGKHHPSPISGGKDGFRFIDKTGDGHYVDNGTFGDGFELLHLLHGWSFKTSCEEIRQALGIGGKDYTPPTQAEKEAMKAAQAMEAERRAQALAIQRAEVAERAMRIWQAATPTDSHPYLKKKGVVSYDLRMDGKGNLILAVRISGAITSIQYINQHGGKFFLPCGEVSGGCYFIKGTDTAVLVIIIVEGYATGASIREATGHHVLVAFNAGNLANVARMAREKYPNAMIILGGDHDLKVFESGDNKGKNKPNAGLLSAVEAAQAVGGVIALPRGKQGFSTDWNDIHTESGLDVVAAGIANALPPEMVSKLLPPHDEAQAPSHDVKVEVMPEHLPTVASFGNQVAAVPPSLVLVAASSIKMERIDWLWFHFLARGKLHIFAGQAGTGKTTIALDLAATVTRGGKWADGTQAPKGSVLIWSGEDDPADSLIPRLTASNADLSKVFFIGDIKQGADSRAFDPSSDMSYLLEAAAHIPDLSLIVVDPIVSAVAGDSHKNAEVRKGLQPLVDLGLKAHAAILGITHFSKGSKGGDPSERVTGSLAFGALARLVMCTVKPLNEDDKPRFIRAKSNISPDGGGFEYELARKDLGNGIEGQHIQWGGALEGTATELMADIENDNDTTAAEDAATFLQDFLKDGAKQQREIKEAAAAYCHSYRTIIRAKKSLEIESKKLGKYWCWKLPYHSWLSDGEHLAQIDEKQQKGDEKQGSVPYSVCGTLDAKTPLKRGENVVIATKKEQCQPPKKRTVPNPLGTLENSSSKSGEAPEKAPLKQAQNQAQNVGSLGRDGKVILAPENDDLPPLNQPYKKDGVTYVETIL